MRLRTSWIASALGALWLASCGGNDDSGLFSSIPNGSGGANQAAGGAGKSGSSGGASSGGAASGGASSGGVNNTGGTSNNAGSGSGGTSNNAGSGNGGTSNNAGSGNGGTSNNAGSGNGGTNNNGGANNSGGGGSPSNGGSPFGGTGGIIVAGNGGSGGSIIIKQCSNNGSCSDDEYCHKNSCAAETGTCERRPTLCPNVASSIVCGCDGYTYLTPCLAASNGVNVAGDDVCGEDRHHHCQDVNDCPEPLPKGAACVDFEGDCGGFRDPECWVLPDQCPDDDPVQMLECDDSDQCIGVCEAAKSGEPFAWTNNCN